MTAWKPLTRPESRKVCRMELTYLAKMKGVGMTFVIAEPCIDILDQACVQVCPVACIHFDQGKDRKLYIDPDECIDCAACAPVCPVEAIYAELDLPTEWEPYAAIDFLWFSDKDAARAKVDAAKKGD